MIAHAGLHETFGELLAGRFWWLLPLVLLGLALVVGGWKVMLVPALVWMPTAIYLDVNNGWHGFGWGDSGVLWNVTVALASFLAVGVGVAAHRAGRLLLHRLDTATSRHRP